MHRRQFLSGLALSSMALSALPLVGAEPLWRPYNPPAGLKKYPTILGVGEKPVNLLKSIKGKPAIVNFWAVWCQPCIRELPIFDQLAQKPPINNLQILTINIDLSQEKADNYIKNNLNLPHLSHNYGGGQQFINAMGFNALPSTFFVHKNGQIKGYVLGFREWHSPQWQEVFSKIFA